MAGEMSATVIAAEVNAEFLNYYFLKPPFSWQGLTLRIYVVNQYS